ncbi:helix-turn-helix transcriptional regulator [Caulobacter sp. 73W]|uniref:Helix-turn-helix transcriptional regulator n=1 Tax=Caulobacter sp. 73W TaxID=3161137 RepID=A0AB39KYJ2_9CAUL
MDWVGVIGRNVRAIRYRRGMTQEDVATAAGIDLSYFRAVELGKRNPTVRLLMGISDALGVELPDLLVVR